MKVKAVSFFVVDFFNWVEICLVVGIFSPRAFLSLSTSDSFFRRTHIFVVTHFVVGVRLVFFSCVD